MKKPFASSGKIKSKEKLLVVNGLSTSFTSEGRKFLAVDNISFSIGKGETVGLVGESGCGKSITSLSLLKMIDPPGELLQGEIWLDQQNLMDLSEVEMRKIRGNEISMIFQEPMHSLNPVFSIGDQIAEVFQLHGGLNRAEARIKAIEMLKLVNIPSPEKRIHDYPHQLSGGMRQRVMIAMALACKPKLLIADEPTTALDVTIQAQILTLIGELQKEVGMAILFISHDLGVIAEICDYVLIMYAGKIVESGTVQDIFRNPLHPYTQGLLASIPRLGHRQASLPTVEGTVPALWNLPKGCRFSNRCPQVMQQCTQKEPQLSKIRAKAYTACYLHPSNEQVETPSTQKEHNDN